jgi:hypothetical protein
MEFRSSLFDVEGMTYIISRTRPEKKPVQDVEILSPSTPSIHPQKKIELKARVLASIKYL